MSNNRSFPSRRAQHEEGLRILCLLDGKDAARGIMRTRPDGRPCFTDHRADFSISHSGRMAAVSFSTERGAETGLPLRTGCDIQFVDPRKNREEIAREFFFPAEMAYISAAREARERALRFCRIWALKECFLKTGGFSVFDIKLCPEFSLHTEEAALSVPGGVPVFSYRPQAALSAGTPPAFHLYEYESPGAGLYVLAAAREETPRAAQPSGPEVRWFSPETLPEASIAKINAALSPAKTTSPKM